MVVLISAARNVLLGGILSSRAFYKWVIIVKISVEDDDVVKKPVRAAEISTTNLTETRNVKNSNIA